MIILTIAFFAPQAKAEPPVVQPPAVLQVCPYCIEIEDVKSFVVSTILPDGLNPKITGDQTNGDWRNSLRTALLSVDSGKGISTITIQVNAPPPSADATLINGIVRRHHVCKGVALVGGKGNFVWYNDSNDKQVQLPLGGVCDGKLVDLDEYALSSVNALRTAYQADVDRIDQAINPENIREIITSIVGKTKLDEADIVEKAARRAVLLLKP